VRAHPPLASVALFSCAAVPSVVLSTGSSRKPCAKHFNRTTAFVRRRFLSVLKLLVRHSPRASIHPTYGETGTLTTDTSHSIRRSSLSVPIIRAIDVPTHLAALSIRRPRASPGVVEPPSKEHTTGSQSIDGSLMYSSAQVCNA
jgi:hypothetical protein